MDAVTLILTLLTAFNLSVMVMKAYGDKFPQPNVRARHAGWLQGWRNTQKPLQRYWIQVVIMFAIMVLFDFAGLMFAGFLVFARLIVFVLGYKRAKLQIAQATLPQAPLTTSRQQTVQAEESPSHAPVVAQSPTPQTTILQAPPLPAGKGSMSKGAWVLLIVIVVCAMAAFLGYLYSRAHPLDNYVGNAPDNSPASSDTTSALSGVLGDPDDNSQASRATTTGEPAPQAAQVQQSAQATSQQAMQQVVQQDMAAQPQGSSLKVTTNTYGNVVASFYPGKSPLDAIDDALLSINSELTVMDMAPSGYPEYQVECESNGQCVGGTGTPMGAVANVAKEMFPVNPADVGQGGITCGQYVCSDGKGNVIGRAPATTP